MNKKFTIIQSKKIAYVDEGDGQPILFIHGNPTSSYLWRNIIKELVKKNRCIAPDLIGMGDSDKLDNPSEGNYSLKEHIKWFDGFINSINIEKKIILVIHDWGSAIGFDFAKKYPERIAGIVYMEAIVCPMKWSDWPEDATKVFKLMRSEVGEELILEKNIFVERILPSSIIRKLSEDEMNQYRKPFLKEGSDRQPTLSWPRQIPIEGEPVEVINIVNEYSEFMRNTNIKKLFINADPGSILIGPQREFCRSWPNQKEVTVKGKHFIQEDSPDEISNEIDIRKDLTLLKKNDQDFFLRNCEKSKVILDGSECFNFLGIKLFLVGYQNQSISDSEQESIYKKAINYLEIAGKKGSKQALKNLGWIFSNKELSFFDLEKSSLYYANSNKTEITKKKKLDTNIEKKEAKKTTNYSDIILAITLIKKIEIYFETTKSQKNKYVTNEQYNNAKKSFKRILDKKQINKTKLAELEKKVIESSNLIFDFLKEDVKIFNKENFNKANQTLEKLNFLLKTKLK